jgi:hypothetical protein
MLNRSIYVVKLIVENDISVQVFKPCQLYDYKQGKVSTLSDM